MIIPDELTADLKNGMSLDKALTKHNISLKETFKHMGYPKNIKSSENLHYKNGYWVIVKKIDGKMNYFGSYYNREDGIKIRDKLKERNWKKEALPEIYEEIGYNHELASIKKRPLKNIIRTSKNRYVIQKMLNGENQYYGTYHDLQTAKKVRNELILNKWDKSLLPQILEKVGDQNGHNH